jgi:multidrug resistance efflux pump
MTQPRPTERHPGAGPETADRNGSLSDRVASLRLGEGDGEGKRPRSAVLPWALCVVLLLLTGLFAFAYYRVARLSGPLPSDGGPAAAGGEGKPGAPASSGPSEGDVVLDLKGNVVSAHEILVSPIIGGRLVYVHPRLEEGRLFHEGDVLAEVEQTEYLARRDRAMAVCAELSNAVKEMERSLPLQLASFEASLEQQQANLWLFQQKEYNARRSGMSAVAKETMQESEANVRVGDAVRKKAYAETEQLRTTMDVRLAQARARADQAWADLVQAQFYLDNCQIKAPVTGTILKKNAEMGNYVNPGAFGGTGGIAVSLCSMADLSDLEIELSIQEREIAKVAEGQECTVIPEAWQNDKRFLDKHPRGYLGKVSRIMPIANRGNSTIAVRVKPEVPRSEAGVFLKPEMGVIVKFKKAP